MSPAGYSRCIKSLLPPTLPSQSLNTDHHPVRPIQLLYLLNIWSSSSSDCLQTSVMQWFAKSSPAARPESEQFKGASIYINEIIIRHHGHRCLIIIIPIADPQLPALLVEDWRHCLYLIIHIPQRCHFYQAVTIYLKVSHAQAPSLQPVINHQHNSLNGQKFNLNVLITIR